MRSMVMIAFIPVLVQGRCNLTDDPLEIIGCFSHMSTVLLGIAKNGLSRMG
jgi:hypothetical protein